MSLSKTISSKFWLLGRAHPRTDGGYKKDGKFSDLDDFTANEVKSLDLSGKPLCIEHKDNFVIGRVLKSFNGTDGSKYMLAYIDLDTDLGRYAKNIIEKGLDIDLSMKHVSNVYGNGKQITRIEKEIVEISLVNKARRSDNSCRIIFSGKELDPSISNIERKLEETLTQQPSSSVSKNNNTQKLNSDNISKTNIDNILNLITPLIIDKIKTQNKMATQQSVTSTTPVTPNTPVTGAETNNTLSDTSKIAETIKLVTSGNGVDFTKISQEDMKNLVLTMAGELDRTIVKLKDQNSLAAYGQQALLREKEILNKTLAAHKESLLNALKYNADGTEKKTPEALENIDRINKHFETISNRPHDQIQGDVLVQRELMAHGAQWRDVAKIAEEKYQKLNREYEQERLRNISGSSQQQQQQQKNNTLQPSVNFGFLDNFNQRFSSPESRFQFQETPRTETTFNVTSSSLSQKRPMETTIDYGEFAKKLKADGNGDMLNSFSGQMGLNSLENIRKLVMQGQISTNDSRPIISKN